MVKLNNLQLKRHKGKSISGIIGFIALVLLAIAEFFPPED